MNKVRIAVIFNDNPFKPRGVTNAVLNRVRYLRKALDCDIDVFCLIGKETGVVKLFRQSECENYRDQIVIDGELVELLTYPFSLFDYILETYLKFKPLIRNYFIKKFVKNFKEYDIICSHSFISGLLAKEIKNIYSIPYYITWHGSDIHTMPFESEQKKKYIIGLMKNADSNVFVSNDLKKKSDRLLYNKSSCILYNGASEIFYKYNIPEINHKKKEYGIKDNEITICYVGNLYAIKNAQLLPDIFLNLSQKIDNLHFLIVGDGKYKQYIQDKIKNYNINCDLLGYLRPDIIPDIFNISDIAILPSKNEGLPLVMAEALKCGCKAIGSNVGGMKEILGIDNVVDLGDNFIERFCSRIIEAIHGKYVFNDISQFSWLSTSKKEVSLINKILNDEATIH